MASQRLNDRERAAASEALTDRFDVLVESSIKSDWLARKLFSAKVIAFNEMQRATDLLTREAETDRRHYLMACVIKKSEEDVQCFYKFLDVLDLDPVYEKYAADIRKLFREYVYIV